MGVRVRRVRRSVVPTQRCVGALCAAVALAAILVSLAGCTSGAATVPVAPKPQMAVLAERNRMIWLGEDDDDQMDYVTVAWAAAWRAKAGTPREIDRTEFDTIQRTGMVVALYFREGVDIPAAQGPNGIAVVVDNGEAVHVASGDLVVQRPGPRYYVVGRVDAEDLDAVKTSTLERMGLR